MRILHVISSLAAGGAEKIVSELASKQSQIEDKDVSIFTLNNSKDIFNSTLDSKVNYHSSKSNSSFSFTNFRLLRSLIRKHDVIHVHLFHPLYIVALFSLFYTKKFVFTEHSTSNRRRSKKYLRFLEKFIYSRYQTIICITESVKANLQDWIGNNHQMVVINNFVDFDKVKNSISLKRVDFGFNDEDILLTMVGRFSLAKDQSTIIKSLLELPVQYKLLLIGDGPLRLEAEALALELKVNDRVHFLGVRKDVFQIIKFCDFGILSSHWEGFGIVALEYMASNLIALGTNVDGLNEVIPVKENLFEVGDVSYLSKRIQSLESDRDLSQSILKLQEEDIMKYDINLALKKHMSVYNNMV